MVTIRERLIDFIKTDHEQIYDEWRELKSFFAGILVISIPWAIILVVVNDC